MFRSERNNTRSSIIGSGGRKDEFHLLEDAAWMQITKILKWLKYCGLMYGNQKDDKNVKNTIKRLLEFCHTYVTMALQVALIASVLIEGALQRCNLMVATESLLCGISLFQNYLRVVRFLQKRRKFEKFIERLTEFNQSEAADSHPFNSKGYENIRKKIARVTNIVVRSNVTGLFSIEVSGFGLALLSIYMSQSSAEGDKERKLAFHAWYPFDIQPSPNYEIAFLFQMINAGIGILLFSVVDSTFFALILYLMGKLENLQQDIRLIINEQNKLQSPFATDPQFKVKWLIRCVKNHDKIIKLIRELDEIFSPAVLIQMICGSTQVCFSIYQCKSRKITDPMFFTFICFLVAIMNQFFVLSWCSNNIITQSENVAIAIYETDWYINENNQNPVHQFVTKMMIHRCLKPTQLTGGKFFVLNLENYGKLIKTAFSYLTMIQAVEEKTMKKTEWR